MFYLYSHLCYKPITFKRRYRLIDIPGFYSYENASEALRMHCVNTGKSIDAFRIVWFLEEDKPEEFVESIFFN